MNKINCIYCEFKGFKNISIICKIKKIGIEIDVKNHE